MHNKPLQGTELCSGLFLLSIRVLFCFLPILLTTHLPNDRIEQKGGFLMNYLKINKDNIDREHICCAMSGKQSLVKKEWMKQRFDEGLVFYRSEERGKCFIEYIPAENAWVPIDADGYIYINCLWIAGALKGHGYSEALLWNAFATPNGKISRDCASFPPRAEKKSFSRIRNTWRIRGSSLPIHRIAESPLCICR